MNIHLSHTLLNASRTQILRTHPNSIFVAVQSLSLELFLKRSVVNAENVLISKRFMNVPLSLTGTLGTCPHVHYANVGASSDVIDRQTWTRRSRTTTTASTATPD